MVELNASDKRNFFMMLHPAESQELAQAAGFTPSSEDVSDIELIDTVSKWSVLGATGCLDVALLCSDWISQFLVERNDLDEKFLLQYRVIFYGFSAALVGLLMDKQIIDIVGDPVEVAGDVARQLGLPPELLQSLVEEELGTDE